MSQTLRNLSGTFKEAKAAMANGKIEELSALHDDFEDDFGLDSARQNADHHHHVNNPSTTSQNHHLQNLASESKVSANDDINYEDENNEEEEEHLQSIEKEEPA
jgi:hypothetical protein